MSDAGTLLAIGKPPLRKDVVSNVITLDPERVLDDLGGMVAVIVATRSLIATFGVEGYSYDERRYCRFPRFCMESR
jgi:hypothetical protein